MTHARTLTRYACLAGLIAGLLAPVSSLAVGTGTSITETTRFNAYAGGHYVQTPSATHVYVRATGKWTRFPDGVTRYQSHVVPVARSTLRTGGLSALARGVGHPAFTAAVIAAGLIIEGSDIFKEEPFQGPFNPEDFSEFNQPQEGIYWDVNGSCGYYECGLYATPLAALQANFNKATYCSLPDYSCHLKSAEFSQDGTRVSFTIGRERHSDFVIFFDIYSGDPSVPPLDSEPQRIPATEEDIEQIDQHIEPELADQLWNGQPIPEWQDAISIIGIPATEVESKGQDMPEVATKIGQWGANMDAQYQGEEEPYPDTSTGGQTADDEMLDQWNEPIPPFPDAEPEWQVEEITSLPDFSFGLGAGSCPAPVTIPHPLGGSFTIEFQKFCDLASMIRGAVIAICMILALYIVLGTRATTS